MQSAKNAVKEFLHKSGKHETDVNETVAPAVKHENVERQEREEVTTAIDKEIHQDHHHTTIQPIRDSEVLPEQHHHQVAPVEHREFEHGDAARTKDHLTAQAAQFKNEHTRSDAGTVSSAAAATGGTHVHHHVYETVQPVIEKQTIEPHVKHVTAPIHEVHHNAAQHHDTTTLPTVTMDQFRQSGGALEGRASQTNTFEGQRGHAIGANDTANVGTGGASLTQKLDPRIDADKDGKKGFMD